jgi:DNA processing protein
VLSKKEKLARLKIMRSEAIGSSTFWNFLEVYGSGEKLLKVLPTLYNSHIKISIKYDGSSDSSLQHFKLCSDEDIKEEFAALKEIGGRIVFFEDELYPPLLRNIPDPPPLLTLLGEKSRILDFYNRNIISVVGSRNSSIHANKFCSNLCSELSRANIVIVSGLARGIDANAHLGSLENGTIAVVAGGINVVYPQENAQLYKEIAKKGCIIAEMPYDTAPQPHFFPRRNRIIAGISYGTIVVEAAAQSGSLITARMALEYNRDVFAVPGFPLDPRSVGCNTLLKEGAILVQGPQDVLDYVENRKIMEKSLLESREPFAARISDYDVERTQGQIMKSLSSVPITIDELIAAIKVPPQEVLAALLKLELSNRIVRLHGQKVCLMLDG